jgi:uncharacterized protein (TIGR02145 family)
LSFSETDDTVNTAQANLTDEDEDGVSLYVQTVYVSTNDVGGYQLSLQMAGSNTSLLRKVGDNPDNPNNPNCPTSDGITDTDCIAAIPNALASTDGRLTSVDQSNAVNLSDNNAANNNKWGYNFSSTGSTAVTTFFTIPAQYSPQVIRRQTGRIEKDPTYITFGAKITTSLAAGTYENDVLYTVIAADAIPAMVPVLSGLTNSISTATGTTTGGIAVNTNIAANCKWSLSNVNYPTMTNAFTGGQGTTGHSTTVTNLQSGGNTIYVACANSSDINQYSGNGQTSVTIDTKIIADGDNIASVTAAKCSAATVFGTNSANIKEALISKVVDTRESPNRYYAIARMPDGKCWMLNNLAFGGTGAGTQFTTGAGTGSTNCTPSYNTWCAKTPPSNNSKQWADPKNDSVTQNTGNDATRCAVNYNTSVTINYTACGYFYNWCAALGNGATGSTYNCSTTTEGYIDIPNAGEGLCPTGWRLPTRNEYIVLWTTKLGNRLADILGASSVWRGAYSGSFGPGNGLNGQGTRVYYWMATTNSTFAGTARIVPEDGPGASAYYGADRYYGFPVRCIIGTGV